MHCFPIIMMFSFLRLISLTFQSTSPLPKIPNSYPFPFSLKFCTSTSHSHSFTLSYLINTLGFTPENAVKASKRYRLETSQKKPDTLVAFFRSHGFSDSQVSSILRRSPQLLSCNPHNSILPKFEFLASKGASTSDIVLAVTKCPHFLRSNLENSITPVYELMRTFFLSDRKTLQLFLRMPVLLGLKTDVKQNLKLLRDEGTKDPNVAFLIRRKTYVFYANGLRKVVDEVKDLGFDPSKLSFVIALGAKVTVSKPIWNAKVEAFKSWGWSEEEIAAAFRRHPDCVLKSKDKINAIMSFWVNQLGWNSLDLVIYPAFFGYSLEKKDHSKGFCSPVSTRKRFDEEECQLIDTFCFV